jgi:hypothetical protein
MRVNVTDFVEDITIAQNADFDEAWAKMGNEIKNQLRTFDPDVTWLNLYLSHDGRPSYNRTITVLTQE